MNFDEIQRVGFEGVTVLSDLTPSRIYSIESEFTGRSAAELRQKAAWGINQVPIFPANGSIIFLESISRKVPLMYHKYIEWVIATKKKINGVDRYTFVSNRRGTIKASDDTFIRGIPKIYDDIYDSGKSYNDIDRSIANLIGDIEVERIAARISNRSYRTNTSGPIGLRIAACTTKQGKPYKGAVYTFPGRQLPDDKFEDLWATSALGLDGGKGSKRTSIIERVGGMACVAKSELEYITMMNNPSQTEWYEGALEYTGIQSYGEEGYSWKKLLLETMDDERYSVEDRCMRVFGLLGLSYEA
jgi:hypothetical protein